MVRWLRSAAVLVSLPVADLRAAELTGTLQQIKQTGKIRIGYRDAQRITAFDAPVQLNSLPE